ncbi:nitroreductase/quinone reductase family protein [Actinoplanes sp. RD1]|uniref:nitroreductase/quinone reductase family protein n=1 Tax=Actinoplanes sp. RD1 TaxID=3064538 RepID=UPI00274075D3|nr:nitroreductase/quinone reductase family protein [Actinoplanes sp. RD1]
MNAFVRATTPAVRAFAGRRWFPAYAVVHHRGRVTGRALAVPVVVMARDDTFVINLPWGARTNWVRNVLAAGRATVRWKGADHPVTDPRIIDAAAARPYYSRLSWAVARALFPAEDWLRLRRA